MIDARKLLGIIIKATILGFVINCLFGVYLITCAQDLAARSCRMIAETVFSEGCLPSSQVLEYQTFENGRYKTVTRQIDAWEQTLVSMNANMLDGPQMVRSWMYYDPADAISVRACESVLEDGVVKYQPVGGQLKTLEAGNGVGGTVNRNDVVEVKVKIHVQIPMIFYFGYEGDFSDLPLSIDGVEEYTMYITTSRYRSTSLV